MFCPKCGTENKDTAKFCKNCGQALSGAELQRGRAAPITVQRKPSTMLLAFTVVLLTLAGVYSYIWLGGPLPSSLTKMVKEPVIVTREVPVTRIVTKEAVVGRPITPVCPTPEVIVKEVIVDKEVPVTVEVVVVKEVPVEVIKEVVVPVEVTRIVIKEVPVPPSP